MSSRDIIIEGIVQPDGTLVLDGSPELPAGRVQVIVRPVTVAPPGDPFWETLRSIWADQEARGFAPRSTEQVETERREDREQWEERLQAIERLQEESRRLRERRA